MKKSIVAILAMAIITVSFLAPVLLTQGVSAATDPAQYYTETGVLGTDGYLLYPYKAASTKIGLSNFGELIDGVTNVGIEYDGARDPWAAPVGPTVDPSYLPKSVWINGWMLSVTYNNSLNGQTNVWAAALFADLAQYGNPWLHVEAPYSCTYEWQEDFRRPGYEINAAGNVIGTALLNGGRKTNGTCITEPMKILYDGPRRFIAYLVTHVWDINQNTNEPLLHLVDVMFTVVFNKVSKQVVVYKEVKSIPHPKFEISPLVVHYYRDPTPISIPAGMLCQFSDREEWDLGTKTYGQTIPYSSYVHFWAGDAQKPATVYNDMYTELPTMPAGICVYENTNITLNAPVNLWGPRPTSSGYYDYAQIISNDEKYVGYAAYWPELSDWSADAGGGRRDVWYRAMSALDVHDLDALDGNEPFLAPLTVSEWDFMLGQTDAVISGIEIDKQFRGVAVYGVTDLNDGDDLHIGIGHANIPDKEAMYQLDMVFNPWDLTDAIWKKDTARWVTKYEADGETTQFYLKYSDQFPDKPWQDPANWPYVNVTDFITKANWDAYASFAERVLIDNTLQVRGDDYMLYYDIDDLMYVEFADPPSEGSHVKILFSSYYYDSDYGAWEWLAVGRDSRAIDSAGSAMLGSYVSYWHDEELRNSALDMKDTQYAPDAPSLLSPYRDTLLPDRTGYRDANVAFNKGRLGFKDDWSCHVNEAGYEMNGLPISSSNIITVGGPLANAVTEYTNDFTDAFATLPGWTGSGATAGVIYSLPCWSKYTYAPEYVNGTQTVGYGIISTFQDLNGTTFLVVYGYTGQDTYYTCWAIQHSDVVWLAFETMPEGVTTLVLKFDYTLHPTDYCFVTIMEALGTISEYDWQGFFLNRQDGEVPPFPDWPDYPDWVTDKYPAIHVDP